jgi:site-specific DNA-cytosine methylase
MADGLKAASILGLGGGMTIGLEQAGIETVATFEPNDQTGRAVRQNRPGMDHFILGPEVWASALEDYCVKCQIDVLFGSPPCQGVSGANARAGADNPKNDMMAHFARAAAASGVKHVFFENIPRMLSLGREHVLIAREILESAGYSFFIHQHNAMHFGASQNRRRVMFVAHKKGHEVRWPSTPEGPYWTLRDAISDLAEVDPVTSEELEGNPTATVILPLESHSEYQEMLRSDDGRAGNHRFLGVPERFHGMLPGTQWTEMEDKSTWLDKDHARIAEGRIFNAAELYRLDPDLVGRTVTGALNKMHPWLDRHITLREASRMMGFPDDWLWDDSKNFQQLAAGVCPPVVKWYGQVLVAHEAGGPMPVPAGRLF